MDIIDIIEGIGMLIIAGILLVLVIYLLYSFVMWIYRLVRRISIRLRTRVIRYTDVIGIVVRKIHEREVADYIWTGKFWMFCSYPEEYNVKVRYKSLTEVFDDEETFDSYEKNEEIPLILVERIDKHGNVIEESLELPE